MSKQEELKAQILKLTKEYYAEVHGKKKAFEAGKTFVNYGGRYYDDQELVNLVDSSLDFWLTAGPWAHKFETRFAKWMGAKHCSLTNSGSSANLLAFMTLTSPQLGERRIKKGDEVITVACGFPTTVTPIIQFGAIPVFVDVTIPSYNIDVTKLEAAYSDKTKAVMIAHSLGNPFDLQAVKDFCDKHNLWLVEDNCDALGSEYTINGETKKTGTIGHIGTSSFYPPHHMTMGEGGAVYTNDSLLNKITNSFRDWGRDCWCLGGVDNTCKYRFSKQFGQWVAMTPTPLPKELPRLPLAAGAEASSIPKSMPNMVKTLASLELILDSKLFIGTYSSNPGMFAGIFLDQKMIGLDFEKWLII